METVKQVSLSHKVPVFGGSAEMVATLVACTTLVLIMRIGKTSCSDGHSHHEGEKPGKVAVETPEN